MRDKGMRDRSASSASGSDGFSSCPSPMVVRRSPGLGSDRSNRRSLLLLAVLLIAALPACSFSRGNIGDEFKPEDVGAVQKGTSTRADVVKALGAPDRILEVNGQEIFQYYRYDIKVGSLLLIIANFSRINIKSDDLYVFFDREGVVQDVVFGKRTDRLKFQFWPFGDS